jgi:hypothetical protein
MLCSDSGGGAESFRGNNTLQPGGGTSGASPS